MQLEIRRGGAMSIKATLAGFGVPVCVVLICNAMIADAFAQAGGRPLILDTQTGIHSGAGGTVLQTGPLNETGMVPARPLGTLPEVQQQGQQTLVVSPYIEVQPGGYSGPQGYAILPGTQSQRSSAGMGYGQGLRSSGPRSGGLYSGSTSVQPHVQPRSQPRSHQPRTQLQSFQQLQTQPRAQPTTPIRPTSAATDPVTTPRTTRSKPRMSTRLSDPHTATGTVTSMQ
jgi:hypothetical protein